MRAERPPVGVDHRSSAVLGRRPRGVEATATCAYA
jgi:hypothetical protein